jgi:EmrB/QacA subfamily drug resistance transporter
MASATGTAPARVDRATRMVAGTVVLGSIMSVLDTTIVNVALRDLARQFAVSVATVHWVSSGYLLALAIVIPLSGWASQRFGARRVWMSSIAVFLVGSMLAGTAWSIDSLIAFRILQGLGGGMIVPVGIALLTRAAGPRHVGRALGVIGIAQVLGPALGPVLGGVLVEHGGWRWIFYVNVPIGLLALAIAPHTLPANRPEPCDRLDLTGFLLLSPGLAALVYGLSEMSSGAVGGPGAFGPILAGIALVAAFVVHAWRAPNPLIDVRLFERRAVAATAGTSFCIGMTLFGALYLLPLYYQSARGETPLDAGLLMAPQGIGAAIMMPIAGRVTDRFGSGRVVPIGLALMLIGTAPFAFAGPSTSYPLLAAALVIRGLGFGASLVPAMAATYARLDQDQIPRATSAINAIQRTGGSVGVALMSVVLERQMRGGSADAFAGAFAWMIGIGVLAFVPAAFLPKRPAGADP